MMGLMVTSSILRALFLFTRLIGAHSQNFKSLISLSQILASSTAKSTVGNVNIIETSNGSNESITLCYLPFLMAFTDGDGIPDNSVGEYDGLAATLLAMEHLNTGNGTIIPEISGINQRCPLQFKTEAFDTQNIASVGANHAISITDRSKKDQLLPCAILGASSSGVSIPTSIISSLRGFPQISPFSTSSALDDTNQFKLFGRTIPSDDGTAIPLLAKLASWDVDHLAVLHIDNAYGNAYADGIRLLAQKEYPNLKVQTVDIVRGGKISEAIKLLRDMQYRYFFGILYKDDLDRIMVEAYDQGIAGTGYHVWLFSDGVGSTPLNRNFAVGSPLEKAYKGSGVLSAVGSVPGRDSYFKFERSMQQLARNKENMEFLADHFPTNYPDGKFVNHSLVADQETFLQAPGIVAPFIYDAVIALGLASCQLAEASGGDVYFTGEELFEAFKNTTFYGVTGPMILNPETGTRDPQSASFSIMNFVYDQDASEGQGIRFKGVQTDFFESGGWENLVSYTFNDGSSEVPPDLPDIEIETNYLSSGLRAIGLVLCGIIVVLALSAMFWTYHNSEKNVVRASQPIFLHIISAGTILMGMSIIPLTVDLGVTDQEGADIACMSFPWLVVTGFSLTFSALFTKTHRINQIMKSAAKFKRMKLSPVDVMKPMIALLLLNIVVLTIWTATDPLKHKTVVVDQDIFLRNIETYGLCYSEDSTVYLAILSVINLGSLLFALFEAYQARNLSSDFQESTYIFLAMVFLLIVSFVGIPVMVIARDHVDVSYFVMISLVFVVSTSILLLIFIPKLYHLRQKERTTSPESANVRSVSDLSADAGIEIKNLATAHAELERDYQELKQKIQALKEENHELKQENCELKQNNGLSESEHLSVGSGDPWQENQLSQADKLSDDIEGTSWGWLDSQSG